MINKEIVGGAGVSENDEIKKVSSRKFKIELLGDVKVVHENRDSIHGYFAWPSVAKLQDGRIAVVSSGFRIDHVCPFGKAVIAYSRDNGETYTKPSVVIDTPLDDRDAGILPFGESGLLVTSFNNTRKDQLGWADIEFFKMKVEQKSKYVKAYLDVLPDDVEEKYYASEFCISHDGGKSFGEIFKSPVTSPHGPILLSDGTILWVGRKFNYNSANEEKDSCAGIIEAYEIKPDGTCVLRGEIDKSLCADGTYDLSASEPHAIELPDGTIICHIRTNGPFTIYQSESKDGGRTWTAPHRIEGVCGAPAHLLRHSSGVLMSLYSNRGTPFGTAPFGVNAMFSTDDGKTWDTENIIYDKGSGFDLGYPCSVELDDGSILTVFYAHYPEKDGMSVILQQRWRFSEK